MLAPLVRMPVHRRTESFVIERLDTPAKEITWHDQETLSSWMMRIMSFDIRNMMNKKISRQSISDPKRMSMKIMVTHGITGIQKKNLS